MRAEQVGETWIWASHMIHHLLLLVRLDLQPAGDSLCVLLCFQNRVTGKKVGLISCIVYTIREVLRVLARSFTRQLEIKQPPYVPVHHRLSVSLRTKRAFCPEFPPQCSGALVSISHWNKELSTMFRMFSQWTISNIHTPMIVLGNRTILTLSNLTYCMK